MTSYKDYVSASELDKRGYQLDKDGVLATEHFQTVEDAVDDFMQNSFDIVQELVRNYRGRKWTDAFYEDMKKTDLTGKALKFQEALKEAIIQQAIYTYDNGDASASAYKGESHYAPKAVSVLWGLVIGNF
jgi:hypothetical protein